jgi:hypothetical protein
MLLVSLYAYAAGGDINLKFAIKRGRYGGLFNRFRVMLLNHPCYYGLCSGGFGRMVLKSYRISFFGGSHANLITRLY